MSLEELGQEAEARSQETNSLAKRLMKSAKVFEAFHKNIVNEYLRKKFVADIRTMTRRGLEDIQRHEECLRQNLEFNRDVWVHGFAFESTDRLEFKVMTVPDSQQLRLERIVLATDFRSRLDSLVSSIEQGAMDDELDISPRDAIWVHVLNVYQQA